ncbi:MAG TPA: GAF domain-containing protein [Gemmatimonadaceae bacterium]|nr:GAF domain-containing protein [Gemmatimonadaceae bacterium]
MAVPARQSWLITQLLGETTDVIAPAQLLVGQLQSDLANELAALQSYALAGDRASLDSYRMRADDSEERVASLERLAVRLDEPSAAHARALRYPMDRWHRPNDALIERGAARSDFTTVLERGQTWYDSSARAVAELSSSLANQVALRDERVRALERLSLAANAGLVLAALVAMSGVLVLTFQEKRLSAALYHRAVEEAALGQMARRLSVAVTHDEAMLSITEGTLAVTGASSAFVEWKVSRSSTISMVMTGEAPSLPCKRSPYRGSLTEMIVMHGASAVTADVEALHARLPALPGDAGRRRVELVVPLFSGQKTRGALVLLRDPSAPTPREDGRRQLQLVSSLASAALRRVDGGWPSSGR